MKTSTLITELTPISCVQLMGVSSWSRLVRVLWTNNQN